MKSFITLCGFVFLIFSQGYGQSPEKIDLSVLKENLKVDKLMDEVFRSQKLTKSAQVQDTWDNCFAIELFKGNDGSYAYQVKKYSKTVINNLVNARFRKLTVGYFQYKSHHVFVWTNSDFSELITKTSQSTTLDFVFALQNNPSGDQRGLGTWHYLYDKGRFTVEDGPPSID